MKASADRNSLKSAVFSRLLIVLAFSLLWVLAIFARLVFLQGYKAEEFRLQSDGQQWGFVELSPRRGDILDRHLEDLAISTRADSIYAHPHQIEDAVAAAQRLGPVLEIPTDALLRKLTSKSPFVYLKRKIPPKKAEEALQLGLKGIAAQEETKRIYPNKELAAHILGFVGVDNVGLGGLEYRYEQQLSGQKGRIDLRF
ncbi:MAG: stage V sporulation protein D, partial [Acidobacteriota bacterium]